MNDDISIAGPGSPVSLQKFLSAQPNRGPLTVLIDNTGTGIAPDVEGMLLITLNACSHQALYYREEVFDGTHIPAYIFRYIRFMMFGDEFSKYPTNDSVHQAFEDGKLTQESKDYAEVLNYLKYIEHNPEGLQILGLVQLIGGSLNHIRKSGEPISLYIELPETSLHPKRAARFMSMFHKLCKEYGYLDIE